MGNVSKLGRCASLAILAGAATLLASSLSAGAGGGRYEETILVSNDPRVHAPTTDPNLVNAWGIAFPSSGDVVVANNGTGVATRYDGHGAPESDDGNEAEVVVIPSASGHDDGTPTGVVFNPTSSFQTGSCGAHVPRFLFASEDGVISAWDPEADTDAAVVAVRANAVYKGIAIANDGAADFVYATDFLHGKVDVFDANFDPVTRPRAFHDDQLPDSYAPFGIRNIGGALYVTFATRGAGETDEDHGPGLGAVDIFDANGILLRRLVEVGGALNAPWGLALAPADFGRFSGNLLVGNFGDGTINAYDIASGTFRGQLTSSHGQPLVIDGLWGISFGNGTNDQPKNVLFFAAGPNDEADGLYGRIRARQ